MMGKKEAKSLYCSWRGATGECVLTNAECDAWLTNEGGDCRTCMVPLIKTLERGNKK